MLKINIGTEVPMLVYVLLPRLTFLRNGSIKLQPVLCQQKC